MPEPVRLILMAGCIYTQVGYVIVIISCIFILYCIVIDGGIERDGPDIRKGGL